MPDHQNYHEYRNAYQPYPARIIRTLPQISDHLLFQIRFEDEQMARNFEYRPGQFVMLSVIGTGEAPFSISSSPTRPGNIELCVRRITCNERPVQTRRQCPDRCKRALWEWFSY